MSKRPSGVAMLGKDTILIADKFGDVYSLPLLPTKEDDERAVAARSAAIVSKPYKPTATSLTVHSGANVRALEIQERQSKEIVPTKPKEQMLFAYTLLLGHVSMLTTILTAEKVSEDNKKRRFIITADRDEHIRVSREPPQAFVIEDYCLGHEAFVNSLCLATPDLLVSGGGDDDIFMWDWTTGELRGKASLSDAVQVIVKDSQALSNQQRIAVSGLWRIGSLEGDDVSLVVELSNADIYRPSS
jgi:tRNA (guanine-N(7)-)-methyltransferase subunit TRM82